MIRRISSLILNAAIAVAAWTMWVKMAFSVEHGVLSAPGVGSLKYFTVLSNLFQGVVSAVYAVALARRLRGRTDAVPRAVVLLKYAATVSVSLTFATVMVFLGRLYGYRAMLQGVILWLHLIIPLAAAFDWCVLDREGDVSLRDSLLALIPMLLYGVGYTANILINGVGEWPEINDWYGFAAGGIQTIPFVFAAIVLATWGLALLEWLPRRRKRQRGKAA